jgi:hypothetical protein
MLDDQEDDSIGMELRQTQSRSQHRVVGVEKTFWDIAHSSCNLRNVDGTARNTPEDAPSLRGGGYERAGGAGGVGPAQGQLRSFRRTLRNVLFEMLASFRTTFSKYRP